MIVRVPASSANLGAGFDAVACAVQWYAEVSTSPAVGRHGPIDAHHPAAVAFARAGGTGPLWVPMSLPMGRGLGSSAALRVGGAVAALVQRHGPRVDPRDPEHGVLGLVAELEGHGDNAAAALYGGVVVTVAGEVVSVPVARPPVLVLWVPSTTSATTASRRALPATVCFDDAVFNVGRAALLIAAVSSGRWDALAIATQDRLHQQRRLATQPTSRGALEAALAAGASGAWLSGSGPSVACWCEPEVVAAVDAALPAEGVARVVALDHEGAVILSDG